MFTLHLLLRDMNFEFVKRSWNSTLIERNDILLWRIKYIEDVYKYREQGISIYYLDETWVNVGDCNNKIWQDKTMMSLRGDVFLNGLSFGTPSPTGKGKRLIVIHIGSEEGFVDGFLFMFKSKKVWQITTTK